MQQHAGSRTAMSTLKFEATPLPVHAQPDSDAPRKKRKRAPAQGAADDCFTCLNRNLKCDRRRPYCSQCLDVGQDCAGYKTQLTWGVGVASRGKLRGLSLPVAGTTKIANDFAVPASRSRKSTPNGKKRAAQYTQSSSPSAIEPRAYQRPHEHIPASSRLVDQAHSLNNGTFQIPHAHRQPMSGVTPTQSPAHGGQAAPYAPSTRMYNTIHGTTDVSTELASSSTLSPPYDNNSHAQSVPYLTPSPTTQYFQTCPTQTQFPSTPNSQTYVSPIPIDPSVLSQTTFYPSEQLYAVQQGYNIQTVYTPETTLPELSSPNTIPAAIEDDVEEINRECGKGGVFPDVVTTPFLALPMDSGLTISLSGVSVVGKTPRMQYLIQYYAEVISPVIVAFDSPSNPLRNQILSLAAQSESLQHAISALSASNIRQRKESGALSTCKTLSARRSSYMHVNLTKGVYDDSEQQLTTQDRKTEESIHQQMAIRMLNQHLAHPVLRKDDSVLATLLMLCLFHICDSGIARFQSQFAGVKKLLALRGNNSSGTTGDTTWMTRIFTLFDSVAATVNDRECQIGGSYIDMCNQAEGDWPYETLSGIDSGLCKPMSRLGRLNVLSQGKSVESKPLLVSRPLPPMPNISNHHPNDFSSFDGNGWRRIVSDENFFNLETASPTHQEAFLREWREVRLDLLSWKFDETRFDGSDPSQPLLSSEQILDMYHISESFRYSSLLYTERLKDPKMPSADSRIQEWVKLSLYHIKRVRADVYLLWPLFITGAECGDEHERNIIRERCLDIQKDSGFMNNSSCLTLLEKVWQGDSVAGGRLDKQQKKPSTFRFRDVMLAEGNDGEWIVV